MNDYNFATKEACRICGRAPLVAILSLGNLYVSDFVDNRVAAEARQAPLELVLCDKSTGGCGLVQLKHTVSHEALYRNYWYRSGMNKTMTDELCGIAAQSEALVPLGEGDFVLDIGANDGTLLRGYSTRGLNLIGFEPARNLAKWNREGTTKIIEDFFSFPAWERQFNAEKAKVITAIAMFYDLDDPNAFVADVKKCLDSDGVFIIQMSYLPSMLAQNAFDNICHEHLEYYSLLSLENLLQRHELEVFDVELNDVNGGSFRIYIKHRSNSTGIRMPRGAMERIKNLRESEASLGLGRKDVYQDFVKRVEEIRRKVIGFIKKEVANGKKICVYGASTKGNTLLQYFGIDHALVGTAAERNQDKWGKKTVGTLIPIISEAQARAEKPDYFLVLPWHFLKEFQERESEYLKAGGKFIIPLPEFKIIGANDQSSSA